MLSPSYAARAMTMRRHWFLPCLILILPLAACEGTRPAADAGSGAADAGADSAAPAVPAEALPGEFVVTTNEPFWQARVEGGEVVLSGPGVEGRRFAVGSSEAVGEARQVHATDVEGTISVTLRPEPCQDSMSGAEFPHTGELIIDGIGPVPGCARPADMPPPAEPGA